MVGFVKAVEVWIPQHEHGLLEFGGGWFGDALRFADISRSMCFGRGEGLPGQVWEQGRPILLKSFEGTYFRRTAAAHAAGLTCAVGVPMVVGDQLTAVLVLFCGDADHATGAIELWRNDPRVTGDLTLVDGYYGGVSGDFEAASRDTYLPRGSGLPGLAWQRGAAVLIDDLAASPRFIRSDEAQAAGIQRGLALPCSTASNDAYVLTLLSSAASPVAMRIESWALDAASGALQRVFGHCERVGALAASHEAGVLPGAGSVGRAYETGVPQIVAPLTGEPAATGLVATVAVPVICDGAVNEVLALSF